MSATNICPIGASALASDIRTVPLHARLAFTKLAVVWSGLGIAYICAVAGGLTQQSPNVINAILAIALASFTLLSYSGPVAYAKQAETLLAGEKQLFEMVASGQPLLVVLDALCRLLDATAPGCSSGVLVLDRAGLLVEHAVAPGLPRSYSESLEGCLASSANGPCGLAASLKTQVIVSDVASETRWRSDGWPALALAHSLKSCWSSPILSSTGEPLGTFAIYQRLGGSPRPFHQVLIQKLTHIASIAIERARTQEALERSEASLAKGQSLSSTGSFFWRVGTDEIAWSEQLYRIFELKPGLPVTLELIGTRVHPNDLPLFNEMIDRARGGASDLEYEQRLLMPDRTVKHLQVIAHGIRGEAGRLEYIGAVQDVTQRRVSEEALGKARSELARVARVTSLGVLTASIAHEVNQPLFGIITNASTCLEMLNADPPDLEGARETAGNAIRDGNRASDVIRRLRALFADKGVSTESMSLNEATREVIALSLSELQRRGVIVRAELADDLPRVTGDRVQLQQVILNLVMNASEAMSDVDDRPRHLVIRTERDDGIGVRLTVQDSGVGFESQDLSGLFEAFHTTKCDGMGIGLFVSRSIIEKHHGRLWATPNDGPGTTFSFSVPCEPESAASARGAAIVRTPAVSDALKRALQVS